MLALIRVVENKCNVMEGGWNRNRKSTVNMANKSLSTPRAAEQADAESSLLAKAVERIEYKLDRLKSWQ